MISLYDINNRVYSVEYFNGSPIFIIEDFYKTPDLVWLKINSQPAPLWKNWERPSYNGKFFADVRHNFDDQSFRPVTDFLADLCGQVCLSPNSIMTNVLKLYPHKFNDYENCYWRPHKDLGYNALIYFNNLKEHSGTNLYLENQLPIEKHNEHYKPWVDKNLWQISKVLFAKYNRLVLFDGGKFWHGAAIDSDTFFHTPRMNQVIFFQPNK